MHVVLTVNSGDYARWKKLACNPGRWIIVPTQLFLVKGFFFSTGENVTKKNQIKRFKFFVTKLGS